MKSVTSLEQRQVIHQRSTLLDVRSCFYTQGVLKLLQRDAWLEK